MKRGYQCDSCKKFDTQMPWNCPGCGMEVCELCFDSFAHCAICCVQMDETQLKESANKAGWDFD